MTGVRRILTKTKSQMAVLMLEDLHGTIEAVVFPRVYERVAGAVARGRDLVSKARWIPAATARSWWSIAPRRGRRRPRAPPPPRAPEPAPSRAGPARSNGNGARRGRLRRRTTQRPAGNGTPRGSAAPGWHAGGGNGARRTASGAAERRVLRVVVPRGEDDNACVRVLEQLHGLVERFPGPDEIHLVLHDRAGARIELAGADILVRHTPDLESQVRTLVGADNLEVVSADASICRPASRSGGWRRRTAGPSSRPTGC